jgi:netrin-G3 ligand
MPVCFPFLLLPIPSFISFVDPPEIVERPKDVAVRSGGIAAFYCRARGEPTPQLSWRKNGRKVCIVSAFHYY